MKRMNNFERSNSLLYSEQDLASPEVRKPHIVINIPKCGGDAFSSILSRHFAANRTFDAQAAAQIASNTATEASQPKSERYKALQAYDLQEMYASAGQSYDFMSSHHFTFDAVTYLRKYGNNPVVYTLMRDPRDRIVSEYLSLRQSNIDNLYQPDDEAQLQHIELAKSLDFRDYISLVIESSAMSKTEFLYNTEASFLLDSKNALREDPSLANEIPDGKHAIDLLIERALANLETVDFVGLVDEMKSFYHCVAIHNGWMPTQDIQELKSGATTLEALTLRDLVPHCLVQHDFVIYERAKQLAEELHRNALKLGAFKTFNAQQEQSPESSHLEVSSVEFTGDWHEVEGGASAQYRWSGPSNNSSVILHLDRRKTWRVRFEIISIFDVNKFMQAIVTVDDRVVNHSIFGVGELTNLEVIIPPLRRRCDTMEIAIKGTSSDANSVAPDLVDQRTRGFALVGIQIDTCSPIDGQSTTQSDVAETPQPSIAETGLPEAAEIKDRPGRRNPRKSSNIKSKPKK